MENERPFQAIFLHLPPQNPDVLAKSRNQFNLQLDIANDLLKPAVGANGAVVEEDFETQRLKFSWRHGLGSQWEAGAGSNITARNGGILDAPIELYHNLVGLGGDAEDNPTGRDNIDRGRSRFFYSDANGNGIDVGSAFGLGDTTVWIKRQLSAGRFASALRLAGKIPTGNDSKILGSGGFDIGVAMDGRYRFAERWALFGCVGASKYGSSDLPGARSNGWQAGLGLEWRVGHRDSVVAQLDGASRAVTTGNAFADRTPVIASVGYKRRLNENRSFWASFSENGDYTNFNAPVLGNIGPDLTISMGYEWRR